jgi:putative FmdB family regulatory protein
MPIYEYECRTCGEKFEKLRQVNSSDSELTCPECGSENPSRVFSVFATTGPEITCSHQGG